MFLKFPYVFLILLSECGIIYAENPRVVIEQGILEGVHMKSYDGRTFSAFQGVPYAKPPIGDLRFKEPIKAKSWNGTLLADKQYICSQLDESKSVIGTEDCLYMYIYVPTSHINRNYNFDVVVHIHGGVFIRGSPSILALPDYLMDKSLILVTFNYRLGAAGFFSTGDNLVPGNNGLKDQVLALKWIKDNIREFGGNSNSITLTGWSAGGKSIGLHYVSPMSRGLFHRGFSSSGFLTSGITPAPLEKAKQLAKSVKCESQSINEMVNCLRSLPIALLVNTTVKYLPCVERGNNNSFLPDDPYKLLKDKKLYDVPLVGSNVVNESLHTLDSVYKNRSEVFSIYNNWFEWGKTQLNLEDLVDSDKLNDTLNKIKEFYLDDTKLSEENGLEKLSRVLTHRNFLLHSDVALRTHALVSKSPVYYYLFKFVPEDHLQVAGPPAASHGVDATLLFKFRKNPPKLKPKDEQMMRLFTEFMANYAKTGIPKIKINLLPITNPKSCLNILEINSPDDIRLKAVAELVPRYFWDSLPIKENNHLY